MAACVGVVALVAVGLVAAPVVHAFAGCDSGSGSYAISDEDQLLLIATDLDCLEAGKTFTVANNIMLARDWTPIGNATNKFRGTFDGNGKTISGLTMTFTSTSAVLDYGGLFGYAQDATIKNITLTGVSITNDDRTTSGPQYVGGIVGYADNTDVLNSSVTGSIDAVNSVGGVAGHITNGSLIRNASSTGTVGSDGALSHVGGIVGYSSASTIAVVSSNVTVTVQRTDLRAGRPGGAGAGGIVGDAEATTISDADAYGVVFGLQRSGGIAGSFNAQSLVAGGTYSITDSFALGAVSGVVSNSSSMTVGGLVGEVRLTLDGRHGATTLRIANSFSTGDVSAYREAGGLVGSALFSNSGGPASTLEISNVTATGDLSGVIDVGGLIGRFARSGFQAGDAFTVTEAEATGAVTGDMYAGGLVGALVGGNISESHATGAVTGNTSLGGLVGQVEGGSITTSYATGSVSGAATGARDGWNAGGLVGLVLDVGSIDQSFATGAVSGLMRVGGLAGELDGPSSGTPVSVTNSYATGSATATGLVSGATRDAAVGGLVGINRGLVSVTNSYVTGAVSAPGGGVFAGGITGAAFEALTASATYWNGQTTGYAFAGGTGDNVGEDVADTSSLTTSEMRNSANFDGWNFSSVWGYQCSTSIFPQLRSINTNATATSCVEAAAVASPEPTAPTLPPTPQAGGSTMNLGGRAVTVSTQPNATNTGLTLNAGPVSMGVGGVTPDGRPLPIGPGGVLVLSMPGNLTVTASGLQAGSTVTQTLYSDPVALGTVTVDATGSFRASPTIPASVSYGNHTLSFTGTAETGEVFSLSVGIRVQSQAAALGANPRLAGKPKRVQPGATALVTLSAAQARCTVRFRAPGVRASRQTNKNGVARVTLRVPTTQRTTWTVTARVTGTGCDPVTTTLSLPVRR